MPLSNTNISFGSESMSRFARGVVLPLFPPFVSSLCFLLLLPFQQSMSKGRTKVQ